MTREEAIKELSGYEGVFIPPSRGRDEAITMAIKALTERTGEWLEAEVLSEAYDIEGVKTWGSKMQCDQCGFTHTAIEGHMAQYNFCPNCGADMRGDTE